MTPDPHSPFAGFRCWDPSRVSDVVQTDAAALAPATLLAVHHGAHIHRAQKAKPVPDAPATESDVLDALLDTSQKLRLVPIIGDSGTGKTHLVKWLRARIEVGPGRRLVYLPRTGTSLPELIGMLLDQLQGGQDIDGVDEVREELGKAFRQADDGHLADRLLSELSRQLENISREPADGREGRRRRGLAGTLPDLFRPPELRDFWLRDGGVIDRFVTGLTTHMRSDDEMREGFIFSPDDLPDNDDLGPLRDLGVLTREAAREVHSSVDLEQAAADLASEAMTRAVPEVFGLTGEVTISQVFRKTRKMLLERGEELIVLIEDLTRLQGVDRELVNVLLDPIEEDGVQVLCDLRVAVAVTTGYYQRLDETFRNRADNSGTTFILDAQFGTSEGAWTDDELADFVSRYLNASRVGLAGLAQAHAEASAIELDSDEWIPNGCDSCVNQETCHDSFGAVEGRGLYPFNRNALTIMTSAVLVEKKFNPRSVLGSVVFKVLVDHSEELVDGRFPSRALEREFPEAPALPAAASTGSKPYPDRDRREVLLRFWGGLPAEVTDLPHGVHDAFRLPEMGHKAKEAPPTHVEAPPTHVEAARPPVREEVATTAVDSWASGADLPRAETVRIQGALYDAVIRLIPWTSLGVEPGHPFFVGKRGKGQGLILRPSSFQIEGGIGVKYDTTAVVAEITRNEKDLLLYLEQAGTGAAIELGLAGYSTIQEWLEDVAERVTKAIRETLDPKSESAPLTVLSQRVALGALVLGATEQLGDCLELAGQSLARAGGPDSHTATAWDRLAADLAECRPDLIVDLVSLSETRQSSRGSKPTMFRAGRVSRVLDALVVDWQLPRVLPVLPADVGSSLERVSSRGLKSAAAEEAARQRLQLDDLEKLLGDGKWSSPELCSRLEDALRSAELASAFPGSPTETRQVLDTLRDVDLGVFQRLGEALPERDAPLGQIVVSNARLRGHRLDDVHLMLQRLDDQFRTAAEAAVSRLQDTGDGLASSAMDDAIAAASKLRDALERVS